MTTRIETQNSTYEIDYEGKRVRRTEGAQPTAPNFAADNVWHEVSDIQDLYGRILFVFPDGKATLTSQIKAAEEVAS